MPTSLHTKILIFLIAVFAAAGILGLALDLFERDPGAGNRSGAVNERFENETFYEDYLRDPPGELIVAIGDSFTLGFPFPEDMSYPGLLEKMLRESGIDARVLNAGRLDTGTDQHLRLLTDQILPRISPDTLLVQLHPNDAAENATRAMFSISASGELVAEADAEVPAGVDPIDWGFRKWLLAIDAFAKLASERGFRLYFVLVAPQSVYRKDVPEWGLFEAVTYERMRESLSGRANFIDIRFEPGNGPRSSPGTDFFLDEDRDDMNVGSRRFNEAGYAFLARTVAARLLDASRTN